MHRGFKVAADGESAGDDIICRGKVVATSNGGVPLCRQCADEMTAYDDPDIYVLSGGHIDDKDRPGKGVCPVQWRVGDVAIDRIASKPSETFALGRVVRLTPNGWPVVRIMSDVEEVSYTCTPVSAEEAEGIAVGRAWNLAGSNPGGLE